MATTAAIDFCSLDRNGEIENLNRAIEQALQQAACLLPSQGPITAFVHHNTLHAFEDLDFDQAVRKGAALFGCHPYFTEQQFRELVASGRIRPEDIDAVLIDQLGDRASEHLGFLGTRFSLYRAILSHELHDGPSVDVRWVVSDSGALTSFRPDADSSVKKRFLTHTKRWAMQELRDRRGVAGVSEIVRDRIEPLFAIFQRDQIENWSEQKWEAFSLHLLWQISEFGSEQSSTPIRSFEFTRHRDWIIELGGDDPDELVNDLLIQFSAVFLDQGMSDWPLDTHGGFYQSFIRLYGQRGWLKARWKRTLSAELARLRRENVSPIQSIQESLLILGMSAENLEKLIESSLLSLRGFAGMIWQLETRGDRVTRGMPQGTLLEFLAIRLLLDRIAADDCIARQGDYRGALAGFPSWACETISGRRDGEKRQTQRRAYRIFELAQLLGWEPQSLAKLQPHQWRQLTHELDRFTGIDRRAIYQLAFERKFRNEALDAISTHIKRVGHLKSDRKQATISGPSAVPSFQIVCCIDDREESFRRYLEELEPRCETFGAAGFFAIPMYYRGAADAHYLPLCPADVIPEHYVREEVAYSLQRSEAQRSKARRTIGTFARRVHVGSRTFTGGWIGTTILGSFATFPLVFRVLFPRLTAKLKERVGGFVRPPEVTRLKIERPSEQIAGERPEQHGLTIEEMATAVERLFRDIGCTEKFAPIFFICGHGSSSLNNPHEAAYNCGACAGGRGGPNARAFAQMANDPRVRRIVAELGVVIPDDTIFIGCYHNTCDDGVTYFDLDDIPDTHRKRFEAAVDVIDEARMHDAHERCRRFASAPLDITLNEALIHVESRSEDLSQARPEYNHATNALCLVGRREWSRDLFLDRRAFLQSYDPSQDDAESRVLERILQAVIPVCAGINLEYYFSCVDPVGYGAGNKLPHNIVSLIGVMDGASSDLRPGLYCQMIEIHEPMRILFVIETDEGSMRRIIANNESIRKLVEGNWVQLALLQPGTSDIVLYRNREFVRYQIESSDLAATMSSCEWHRGWRDNLKFASVGPEWGRHHDA